MDRKRRLRRNPWMPGLAERLRDSSGVPDAAQPVDIVALSADLMLYQAIRDSVSALNPVWRARSPEESVDLLMTGRCGVLLIDMGAVSAQPASFVQQISDQFPDVVIVVAGRRDDEAPLAPLITEGRVYRFMHKPLSPRRSGLFLNAAIRCHIERRGERPSPQLLGVEQRPTRPDVRKWMFVSGGLLLFLLLLGAMLMERYGGVAEAPAVATTTPPSAPRQPATLPSDPVLSAARAAFAAGRYESPPGRNALDLYTEVLVNRPDHAEASKGLADTTQRLLAGAEATAASGDLVEARRVVDRVLAIDPGNHWALALRARLAPPVDVAVPLPVTVPDSAPPEPDPAPAAIKRSAVPVDPLQMRDSDAHAIPGMSSTRPVHPTSFARRRSRSPATGQVAPQTVPALPIARSFDAPPTPAAAESAALPPRRRQPVATADPQYPPQALRDHIEGWVEIAYTVDESGATRDLTVTASEPQGVFDEAALNAVASWRYLPSVVNGQPVPERTAVTLRFNVSD
jgi:TonB family protein